MTEADKMFEQLGYIKTENEDGIWYDDEYSEVNGYTPIYFCKATKELDVSNTYVDMPLLKAINEKVKEMGWYDKQR